MAELVPPRRPLVVPNPDASDAEVLRAYVGLVREWRGAGRKEKLHFRQDDVAVLGGLLGTDPDEIERRLIALTGCSRVEARLLRKWLMVAMVAMPLALGTGLVSTSAAAAATPGHAPAATHRVVTGTSTRQDLSTFAQTSSVKTSVGVLGASTLRASTSHQAGIQSVVVAVHWSEFAPTQGAIDQQYVSQIKTQISKFTGAGMQVILSPGLEEAPAWVFGLNSSTRFVDQHGTVWHGSPGENVPDAVFDSAVRQAQQSYLLALGHALAGEPISAVRAGGLCDGELRYPSAGLHNSYWAFSADAQAQSPVPGWRPGDPGKEQASKFINWYLGSITKYQTALVGTTSQAFPSAQVMALYPSWGIRPGQVAQAVAGGLDGNSPAEQNGSLQEGLDFASQVAALPANTTVYSTDLAAPNQGSGTTGEAPIYYLASLAAAHHLPLAGENAGQQTEAALSLSVQRAHALGLTHMLWMDESDLYEPSPGAPTLAQLGAAAHSLGQDSA